MKDNINQARKFIALLNLSVYSKKVKNSYPNIDIKKTEAEYRQHLLLCYINEKIGGTKMIVPTKNADLIWHKHLLDEKSYEDFCTKLLGKKLNHYEGLEVESQEWETSMKYTREINKSVSKEDRFIPNIFSGSPNSEPSNSDTGNTDSSSPSSDGETSSNDGGSSAGTCGGSCGGACGGGG